VYSPHLTDVEAETQRVKFNPGTIPVFYMN